MCRRGEGVRSIVEFFPPFVVTGTTGTVPGLSSLESEFEDAVIVIRGLFYAFATNNYLVATFSLAPQALNFTILHYPRNNRGEESRNQIAKDLEHLSSYSVILRGQIGLFRP